MAARVANIGLACGSALALLAFVIFFYWYSVTGQRQFTSPVYVVVYYVLPLTLAAALLAALRLQPVHKINLIMLIVASCTASYAMELFLKWRQSSLYGQPLPVMTLLSLADSSDRQGEAAALGRQWGTQIDPRTAEEVLDALRRTDPDAVPIMTASNHLFVTQPDGSIRSAIEVDGRNLVPLGAVANRTTVLCNEVGSWVQYQSDRHGFNNPTEAWSLPVEIGALGDSFTHGYCVPPAQNFVALIRQRYPATLNLGMAGDGPMLMLATLTEYLTSLQPKVVLWFYFEGNDLDNLSTFENKNAELRGYLTDGYSQESLMRQDDIDRAIVAEMPRLKAEGERVRTQRLNRPLTETLTNFAKLSTLRQQLGLVGGIDPASMLPYESANMALFRDILLQARTRVERWGGRLVFVYLPDWDRYAGTTTPAGMKRGDVIAIAKGLGIPVIDADSAFLAHGDPLSLFPFRRPGHYNAEGHRIVAEAVLEALPAITGTSANRAREAAY